MNNPKMLKNSIVELDVLRLGSNMEGVASLNGYTIFVDNALPGEKIVARIERCEKNYGFAKLLELKTPNPLRVSPPCPHFEKCGGCACQHMDYEWTLEEKAKIVDDYFYKNAKVTLRSPKTIGLSDPWHCRNKTSLPVRQNGEDVEIGFYKKRSHMLIDIEQCPIAHPDVMTIVDCTKAWMSKHNLLGLNEKTYQGHIRHIVIRNNIHNELMVVIVTNGKLVLPFDELIEILKDKVKNFVSLYQNVNTRRDNVILGLQNHLIYGKAVLMQTLLGLNFEISPLSFLQVNNGLTETLYQTAIDMADVGKNDCCIDAYAGAGTLSLLFAKHCRKVLGIEIIEDAVKNAHYNAKQNGISNVEFICGKVEEVLPKLAKQQEKLDVLILDPPRKGVEKEVVDAVGILLPHKIIYISCNPATQARDVKALMAFGYEIIKSQSVDMFCFSSEVENVLLLTRKI